MRCREHRGDLSSTVGVCATCLRERLDVVVAEQQQQTQVLPQNPPPLLFPRSVSPYVARRKSQCDQPDWSSSRLSYPTSPAASNPHSHRVLSDLSNLDSNVSSRAKKRFLSFNILRPRSEKLNQDRPRTSTSWLSSVFSFRRRPSGSDSQGSRRRVDPGMSPVIGPFLDVECSPCSGNGGYNYKTTPTAARPGKISHSPPASTAGLGLCLSPLVWTSPHHHRPANSMNGLTDSGGRRQKEVSFWGNRSRKLFDTGRR